VLLRREQTVSILHTHGHRDILLMNGNFRLFALATIVDRYLECDRYEFLLN